MKLQNLISRLQQKHPKKIDLSLGRTFNLLKKLGNPQDKLKNVITVVGTNAKASMCYSLKAILNEAGYHCNLYTSPHLQSYTERFIYNDIEINEENLIELLTDIEKILGNDQATLFELLTCAFIKNAEQFKHNVQIMECGMYHKYDSVNCFKDNLGTLLGFMGLDHLQWIENKTIDGVIYEKTSKLLNSNIFVNQQENKNILSKIEKALVNNGSKKYFFGKDFNILRSKNGFIEYQDQLGEFLLPEPNILGDHQLGNISTAISASRTLFNIKNEDIKKAITKIELKGRLQEITSGRLKDLVGQNQLLLDGGHNIGASKVISNWIKKQNQNIHLIVGMMKDKDHQGFIDNFKDIVKSITIIDIPNQEGSIRKEDFKNKLKNINKEIYLSNSITDSIKSIPKYKNCKILIVGSLYLVGEILNLN